MVCLTTPQNGLWMLFSALEFHSLSPLHTLCTTDHVLTETSGLLTTFRPHDIRAGGVRDLTYIPVSEMLGTAIAGVAKAAGHKSNALFARVTDEYARPLNTDLNQLKEKYLFNDRKAPKQGAPRKKQRLSSEALDTRLLELGFSPEDREDKATQSARRKAAKTLYAEARETEIEKGKAAPPMQKPQPLPPKNSSKSQKPKASSPLQA